MAKKIDKETLIKNRFWILLGVMVPLVLGSVGWLGTDVTADIKKKKNEIAKQKRELDGKSNIVATQNELKNLTDKENELRLRQQQVWQAAWNIQKDLIQWPAALLTSDAEVDVRQLYFGDFIPDRLRDRFTQPTAYAAQVQDVVKLVEPTGFNGGWAKVVKHVANWDTSRFGVPTWEELWLAEEDLAVQRELFRAVQETNRVVSQFKPETDPDKAPAANPAKFERYRGVFRNPYWEMDLTVAQNQGKYVLRGTIKNVGNRRQMLGRAAFDVRVRQSGAPERINIQGESLSVDQSAPLAFMTENDQLKPEKELSGVIDPEGLFGVEQVLDLYYVPVKRIEQIAIGPGAHSHRTYSPILEMARIDLGPLGQGASGTPEPSPTPPPTPPYGAPGFRPSTDGRQANLQTNNGLERNRYMKKTDQVRRLPIAFVAVIDPAYEQELRTALTNSTLRLQLTQVDWSRFRGEIKPEATPRPLVPVGQPLPMDPNAAARAAAAEQPPMSLIEVAYYGIASMYERFPPKSALAPPPTGAADSPR